MNKMNLIFEKFANDKNLLDEFLKKSTLDEMFDFCVSIDKNITKQEFDEYISEAIDSYEAYVDKTVNDSELAEITGGTNAQDKKLMGFIYEVYSKNGENKTLQTGSLPVEILVPDSNKGMQTMPDGTMQNLK